MCWMVDWEKRRIKCDFLLSPDLQLLATKIIFYFAKGPLKLKYHKVQKKNGEQTVQWDLDVVCLFCYSTVCHALPQGGVLQVTVKLQRVHFRTICFISALTTFDLVWFLKWL